MTRPVDTDVSRREVNAVPFWLRPRAVPFWLRPKWVVGHVLVVALVVTFVGLGLWQLERLDERRDRNAEITARSEIPVAPIGAVVPPDAGLDDVDDLEYRRVSLTGTYDAAAEVLVRPRSLDGASGWHVVTPLVLPDGRAALVTRGFAPLAADPDVARAAAAPPGGEVTVTGLVFPTQERQGIGPTDPDEGTLLELARVDVGRVQQQYDRELLPVYVQLEAQDPPQGEQGLPQVLPTQATDDGPHLSYAVQWFLFAGVGVVGWPVLLKRTAQEERRAGGWPAAGGGAGGPGAEAAPSTRGGGSPATAHPGREGGTGRRPAATAQGSTDGGEPSPAAAPPRSDGEAGGRPPVARPGAERSGHGDRRPDTDPPRRPLPTGQG